MCTRLCVGILLLTVAAEVLAQERLQLMTSVGQPGKVWLMHTGHRDGEFTVETHPDHCSFVLKKYLLNHAREQLDRRIESSDSEREKLELAAAREISRFMREFNALTEQVEQSKGGFVENGGSMEGYNQRLKDPFGKGSLYWKIEQTLLARKQDQ